MSAERRAGGRLLDVSGRVMLAALLACVPGGSATAQTIDGTLLDLDTDQPVELGLVLMFTEAGDSVGMAVTDEAGRFTLTSPEPGSFLLLASALGYKETPAGVFELGRDGVLSVQFRIRPQPLPIDALVASVRQPVLQHQLVRNGFVRRLQRGLGAFVTPHDIERSPATSTEQLLEHIPGVRVADVRLVRPQSVPGGDTVLTSLPRPDVGETVQIRGPGGRWCTPTVYVDGLRSFYTTDALSSSVAVTLSTLAPLASVEAIEVYRRPAEVPMEYGSVGTGSGGCGVLVVWTDTGSSAGRAASVSGARGRPGGGAVAVRRPLESVDAEGPPPTSGERVRMQLDATVAERLGLPSPWEATFLGVRDRSLLGRDASLGMGRAFAVPLEGVEALQVERERAPIHALKRGAVAGAVSGAAMWQFLRILCSDRCGGGVGSAWFPASALGLVVGVLVGAQGPGTHWVAAPLPERDAPTPFSAPWTPPRER